MQVKHTEGSAALDLDEWRELVEVDAHRSIFSTVEWNRLWWEEFGQGKQLHVLTFVQDKPVGLAALMIDETEAGKRIRFLGGDDLTDYLGPLAIDPGMHREIADGLVTFLAGAPFEWDYFEAKCLPVPFGFAEWLVEAADRRGLSFESKEDELTAVLPLPGSFDAYLHGLTQKNRHELRRKLRKFDAQLPAATLVSATDASLERDVSRFVEMHRGSEGLKGKFFGPERETFFSRMAEEFEPRGWLSLDFLESEGTTVAATFSFIYDGVFYLYNSAYQQEYRALSPGLVLVAKLIERSIEQGLETFDFLRGRERYKSDLGGEPLPLYSVTIWPS